MALLSRACSAGALALLPLCTLGLPLVQIRDEEQLAPGGWMSHLLGQAPRLLGAGQPDLCISAGCHVPCPQPRTAARMSPLGSHVGPATFWRHFRHPEPTSECRNEVLQDSGNPIMGLRQ